MHQINIKRADLLVKIKENRDIHAAEYKEAYAAFKEKAKAGLLKLVSNIDEGKDVELRANLPVPSDHTKDYDRIIKMLEMSNDDIILLDSNSFDQYVLDEWSWKSAISATNAFYKTSH